MPSISQSTPSLAIHPVDMNRNGVRNRRGYSAKQEQSVLVTKWPLVTRTAYETLARGKVPDEGVSLRLRRLCRARESLGLAMLALDGAMHDHRPGQAGLTPEQIESNAKVWQELRAARAAVEKRYLAFPLEMV